MEIRQQQNGSKGKFYIGEPDVPLAEMVYNMSSEKLMIIEHTEVNDELRGQNIGHQLLKAVVEFARTHEIKIIPLCPFAASVFKKNPAYADVLKK